jgi:hypothetical protein
MFPQMPLTIPSRLLFHSLNRQCLGATILAILVLANIVFPMFFGFNITQVFPSSSINQAPALDPPMKGVSLKCCWSPRANNRQCVKLLSSRMKPSFRRWLFFGDSTMYQLLHYSPLKRILVHHSRDQIHKACPMDFSCTKRLASRCHLNQVFGLPYQPDRQWFPPNYTLGEGPVSYGLQNPYCSDCNGCSSELVVCTNLTNNNRTCPASTLKTLYYGGYISMEFARDVKIQSPHFGTSQENIALGFLNSTQWNQDLISSSFGPTACILGGGFHDMRVPNITLSRFIANVKWYLRLLHPTCGHFIWVANTAPATSTQHNFPQGYNRTLEWNTAVSNLLENTRDLRHKSTFVDVFHASISFPHADNMHMDPTWYRALGAMFASMITLPTEYWAK